MAAIAKNNVTYVIKKNSKDDFTNVVLDATIGFGNGVLTYPANGIPLTDGNLACPNVIDSLIVEGGQGSDYIAQWDPIHDSIRLFEVPPQPVPAPGVGTPAMGVARSYAALAASALTGSAGGSVLSGNIGIYPGLLAAITNFPPSTYTGVENAGNAAAQAAQAAALSAYLDLQSRPSSTIATELGGQNLGPGVYSAASGTFQITGGLTLTLTGSATDVFVFQTATTLITGIGAGGHANIALAGGALASNVYFVVGSSATIASAASSAGSIFNGNVIAQSSITATQASTINGSLIALTGAITYSAGAASSSAVPLVVVATSGNLLAELSTSEAPVATVLNVRVSGH
jgi:hypothetical protein